MQNSYDLQKPKEEFSLCYVSIPWDIQSSNSTEIVNASSVEPWDFFQDYWKENSAAFQQFDRSSAFMAIFCFPSEYLRMSSPSGGSQYKCTELSCLGTEGQNTLWTSSLKWVQRGRQRMFCNSDIFKFWANTLYLSAGSIRGCSKHVQKGSDGYLQFLPRLQGSFHLNILFWIPILKNYN